MKEIQNIIGILAGEGPLFHLEIDTRYNILLNTEPEPIGYFPGAVPMRPATASAFCKIGIVTVLTGFLSEFFFLIYDTNFVLIYDTYFVFFVKIC